MTTQQVKALAKSNLSPKRFKHVENVAEAAKELSVRYGADPAQAELAAWLHDILKEKPKSELLQLLRQDDIMSKSTQHRPEPIWHGPAAAVYARDELGIEDEMILSAVACHTTGKKGMSVLDKVIYLADGISKERHYPGVDQIRELAQSDLNTAVEALLEHSIQYVKQTGGLLDPDTVDALEELQQTRR